MGRLLLAACAVGVGILIWNVALAVQDRRAFAAKCEALGGVASQAKFACHKLTVIEVR